jgi:hypothetical protein
MPFPLGTPFRYFFLIVLDVFFSALIDRILVGRAVLYLVDFFRNRTAILAKKLPARRLPVRVLAHPTSANHVSDFLLAWTAGRRAIFLSWR